MKRILITGATGFIGRQVLSQLEMSNIHLIVVAHENRKIISKEASPFETIINTKDLFAESVEWWTSVLLNVDTIIHLAWYVEPGKYLHSSKNLDCLQGTLNMAKAAVQAGVRRIIGIGTCFEYDLSYGILSTDTPLKPENAYACAKAATYMLLSQTLTSHSIEFAWCRLFYLYGEGEDSRRLVPYLRAQLEAGEIANLTSGHQIRDYLNVSEVGRVIVEIAFTKKQGPINICSGIPVTVRQIAENIADEYNRRDLLKFGTRDKNSIEHMCIVGIKTNY